MTLLLFAVACACGVSAESASGNPSARSARPRAPFLIAIRLVPAGPQDGLPILCNLLIWGFHKIGQTFHRAARALYKTEPHAP